MLAFYPQQIVLCSNHFLFHRLISAIQVKLSIKIISTTILLSLFNEFTMKSKTFKKRTKKPVGLIYDHINFHIKYNRKVLQNNIRKRCEEIIQNILDELGCKCVEVNAQPNHVHILIGIPLTMTPSHVAQKVKCLSSYLLRKEFSILKKQIPKALWAPSSTHQSVGNDMIKVKTYIKYQDKHHDGQK